ncbi:efflux RND transporter permease subunit [Myxococcus sp. CA027]|uniref:efflux RND transporter permease subunit n=1 Tax=Myxococcus TaxID=32 RepID=UPI002647B9FC|nr:MULTISPECIES: efflux RND transporter permease subunit [unclassified Myxococcus]
MMAALALGAETRAPMSIAVLGGLSVSTVLSLLVVPAFYVIADRMKTRVGARLGKKPDAESGPHPPRTNEPRPATHG